MDESEEHSNGGGGEHHDYEWKLPAALSANTTSVHVTALDGVVNVNSLFTVAVFVGLSLATPGELRSLAGDPSCDAGPGVARSLLAGGGGLLLLPLLQPRCAGAQAGAQPNQLQGPARHPARPHRRPRAPPRDAGLRRRLRRRVRLPHGVHGDGRADPARHARLRQQPRRRQSRVGARRPRHRRARRLRRHRLLHLHPLNN